MAVSVQSTKEARCTTIGEIRRQLHAISRWPIYMCADGTTLEVPSLDQVALPTAGNLLSVFQNGAYVVLDCSPVSAMLNQAISVEASLVRGQKS